MTREDFTEWLCREMPPNTVIGDPKWWARRIFARLSGDGFTAQTPTWPEPITDRRPTKDDEDEYESVLWLGKLGWVVAGYDYGRPDCPWLHTPSWRPKPTDPRQQALADLATLSGSPEAIEWIRRVLEAKE